MGYSGFQQASIDAIADHFQRKDNALCADEAGLGKTFIARGVIEQMADAHLRAQIRCAKFAIAPTLPITALQPIGNSKENQKARITAFMKSVLQLDQWKYTRVGTASKELTAAYEHANDKADFWFRYYKHLPNLLVAYHKTKAGVKRQTAWDYPYSNPLQITPFRVLYVCSNLAIAEQNARKLSPVPQRSNRGSGEKPDRLSVLWHFLKQYPNPYLELYPITSTIVTKDTEGTAFERTLLGQPRDLNAARKASEEKSLQAFTPNLVIFDEFQNFGGLINLINEPSRTSTHEKVADDLKRVERIVKHLYGGGTGKKPKSLYLSATPFHMVDDQGREGKLSLDGILKLLGWDGISPKPSTEDALFNLGFFRNERYRLLGGKGGRKDEVHIPCSGKGLLSLAVALDGTGQGNKANSLLRTTPHLEASAYGIDRPQDIPWLQDAHPRYQALRNIVCARTATVTEDVSVGDLQHLLWIPPTCPSRPLGGIFGAYGGFSKTLAFSGLQATPPSVCHFLNEAVPATKMPLRDDVAPLKDYLIQVLTAVFGDRSDGALTKCLHLLLDMLAYCGEPTAQGRVQYCQDGCFEDVLREFAQLYTDDSLNQLTLALKFYEDAPWNFAQNMDQTMLNSADTGVTLRRTFNAPFRPFVVMTTSIGAEGLDFHLYCNRLVHYTKPSSVIRIEQINGRIDRRDSLAVRRHWQWSGAQEAAIGETGGLSPHWDSGDQNLHYYYLHTEMTGELDAINQLQKARSDYRTPMGTVGASEENLVTCANLSPFARGQAGKSTKTK